MKRYALIATVLALVASPCLAQEEDYFFGELKFSVLQTDSDTISSKFQEYRDLSEGPRMSFARMYGKKGDFRYDLVAKNIGLDDQRYRLNLHGKTLKLDGDYYKVPHNFGNGGKSILNATGPGQFTMSDTLQSGFQNALTSNPKAINYLTLRSLVQPTLDAAPLIDLKLSRERGNLVFAITPEEKPVEIQATYFRERRTGTRSASGTSFGFGNVVETPEPLHYLTQDYGVRATFDGNWGVATALVRYNTFQNRIETELWDNPFRITDSTHPNAYTAPSTTTQDGPNHGLMALPPDNEALTGTLGATFKFGEKTRLSADVSLGDWKQNETPFIPYTTNTAIKTPGGENAATAHLPATALDGQIKTTVFNAFFTTRATDNLRLNARWRHYDLNNDTPRLEFDEGYVRFDAVWEEIPRITVPNDYAFDRFEALAAYDIGDVTLEGGYRYAKTKRTWREAEETTDNGLLLKLDYRGTDWLSLRGFWEAYDRDHDEAHYDIEHAEHLSFLEAESATNQSILRRPDTAKKDQDRYGATVQVAPTSGKVALLASYFKSKDEYDQTEVVNSITGTLQAPLGLIFSDYDTFTADANFMPSDRAGFSVYYTLENYDNSQSGRQSGATPSVLVTDNWLSDQTVEVNTFGATADFVLVPEKWDLGLWARWQRADGNNDFTTPPGGRPAVDIAEYDDTELTTIALKLSYRLAEQWSLALGGFWEDYSVDDSQTGGTLNYMPASFFLAANDQDYQATVAYVQLKYNW